MKFLLYRLDQPYNVLNKVLDNIRITKNITVMDCEQSNKVFTKAELVVENNNVFAISDINCNKYGKLYPHCIIILEMNKDGSVNKSSITGVKLKKVSPSDDEIKRLEENDNG